MENIISIFNGAWAPAITIIICMFAGFGWVTRRIDRLECRMDQQAARTDRLYEMFVEQSKEQAVRTDKLYQMFVDLLKERK